MNNELLFQMEMPADIACLQTLGATIHALLGRINGLAERDTLSYNIQLAVHEVCVNMIEHAYGGRLTGRIAVAISLLSSPRRLCIEMRDQGEPFDIDAVPAPNLNQPQVRGYGLFLIRELMDTVTYTILPDANVWQLVKHL